MKNISFIEFLKFKIKQHPPLFSHKKEKEGELSINELIKYKQLKLLEFSVPGSWLILPIKMGFWLALLTIVADLAYGIDITKFSLIMTSILFRLWIPLIIAIMFSYLIIELGNRKQNKKLFLKIISERKGKK